MRESSYFETRRWLEEATKKGKYFITISYLDGKEIKHYFVTNKFPKEDLIPTLEHLAQEISKVEAVNE